LIGRLCHHAASDTGLHVNRSPCQQNTAAARLALTSSNDDIAARALCRIPSSNNNLARLLRPTRLDKNIS
jgi:hypothetical protein